MRRLLSPRKLKKLRSPCADANSAHQDAVAQVSPSALQVLVLSQVLACNATLGYEDLYNMRVHKFNGTALKSLQHLAQLSTACTDKYMRFDLDHSVSSSVLSLFKVAVPSTNLPEEYLAYCFALVSMYFAA